MLFAERIEDPALPTVLIYGHGDVVAGYDSQWKDGRSPWQVTADGDRWYGRGTADNKGQHTINIAALGQVLAARGRLGFNAKLLLEMGEEVGSPGLRQICETRAPALRSDVLIASDGPRLRSDRPTIFLGSRGAFNFDLVVDLRDGAHHSGNWGGLLANPGIVLANAIASMVDARGRILVAGLRRRRMPDSVRRALADIEPGEPDGPAIDANWGEPGLTPAERVFGWNSLEVLAFRTGNPDHPVNAIPPRATAHLQMRFVAGCDWRAFVPAMRTHLDLQRLRQSRGPRRRTRSRWRRRGSIRTIRGCSGRRRRSKRRPERARRSCRTSAGRCPTIASPTCSGCRRSGCRIPIPRARSTRPTSICWRDVAREGLAIMTGLFWDLGEKGVPASGARPAPLERDGDRG